MMTATSTEQSTDNSCAFLNRPPLRFKKVTERFRSSLMALISIFLRPMVNSTLKRQRASNVEGYMRRERRGSESSVVEGRGVD